MDADPRLEVVADGREDETVVDTCDETVVDTCDETVVDTCDATTVTDGLETGTSELVVLDSMDGRRSAETGGEGEATTVLGDLVLVLELP